MLKQLIAVSLLSVSLAASAAAQSRSPSGDQSGATKGIASDTDPTGKAVGNEPAMVDPHSTGSINLNSKARIECSKKMPDGKTVITHHSGTADQDVCK